MRFKEFLQEAAQLQPVDFSEFEHPYHDVYAFPFSVGGENYRVTFDEQAPGVWERMMRHVDAQGRATFGLTRFHKNQYPILGYQFGALKAFLQGLQPQTVHFSASKADRGRDKVYERMLKRMDLAALGYKYRSADEGTDIRFFVEKI